MRRYGYFFPTCSLTISCLLSLTVAGCDDNIADLETESSAATRPVGQNLSKKGGAQGGAGGGGDRGTYEQTLSDGLVGTGPVVLAKDTKRTLETVSTTFVLDFNFDSTAAKPITHVQSDPAGRTRDEILADGECAFVCADPDCSAAPGGADGVRDRLHGMLTRTGDTRPLDLRITVGMQHLGEVHGDHFIRIRDYTGPGGSEYGGPGYPYMDFGKCGAPDCQPIAEFIGPSADPNDATVARTFRFYGGTVAVDERFISTTNSGGASLICSNLDEVLVTVEPASN